MTSALFHSIYASVVFVVCYVLITTERFNKTKIALAGAVLMFFLPLISADDVFYSRDTGVNWDVLFLLLGYPAAFSLAPAFTCPGSLGPRFLRTPPSQRR